MLLLKELIKHTAADHPDYLNLKTALEKVGEITDIVNDSMKQNDMWAVWDMILEIKGIRVRKPSLVVFLFLCVN
jgi:hypothetical protein